MSLHVPTMLVALLLVFVLFGVSLTFAHPFLREKTELRLWAMGTWTLVAGFILLVVRAFIPTRTFPSCKGIPTLLRRRFAGKWTARLQPALEQRLRARITTAQQVSIRSSASSKRASE